MNGGEARWPFRQETARRRQSGFTLLELLVSIAIFVIVLVSIYSLLEVGRSGRFSTLQRIESLQNVRIALNTLSREALNSGVGYENIGAMLPDDRISGLLGLPADPDTEPDRLTPVVAQNNVDSVNGRLTDRITLAFQDDSLNNGQSIPIDRIANSGAFIRIASPFDNGPFRIGEVLTIIGSSSALGVLTNKAGTRGLVFSSSDPLNINQPGANSPILKAFDSSTPASDCGGPPGCSQVAGSIKRLNWVTYFVRDEDGTGPGTGTLIRRLYGGSGGWVDMPLAFGIEDFQITYVLQDGSVVDAPTRDQMGDIRQIRVTVTVRSPEINPRTNQPYRTTMTTSVSTRNLGYEERP
jgi:prepilin-type N-terminal cleavage/methylation domain-containing protein